MRGADQNFTSLRKRTLFRGSLSLRDGVCIRADDLAAHLKGTFHELDRTNGAAVVKTCWVLVRKGRIDKPLS